MTQTQSNPTNPAQPTSGLTAQVATPPPHRAYGKAKQILGSMMKVLEVRNGVEEARRVVKGAFLSDTLVGSMMIVFLDPTAMTSTANYQGPDVLKGLRATTGGYPLYKGNGTGMRYIVLLGARPSLPTRQPFAGWRKGLLQLGVRHGMRPVEVPWQDLGHCLIAGMTQWGKSTALRLFVVQAAPEGFEMYLGDFYGNTFGPLAGIFHPQIKSLALTGAEYLDLAQKVKAELDARIELYRQCAGAPDSLAEYNKNAAKPLRSVLVLIDEHTAATKELGGRDGEYNLLIERILRTGLKYGIQVVLASQDFFVEDVDRVRSHCATKLCLRVESASLSRTILQTGGAERLKYKGRALSNKFGELQLFLVTKDQLVAAFRSKDTGMTPDENRLARFLYSYPEKTGWVDIDRIRAFYGCSHGFAKDIRSSWVDRGLAKHHPELNNAIYLVHKFEPLPENEIQMIISKIAFVSKLALPARAEGVN
jgi:hypothetical protein